MEKNISRRWSMVGGRWKEWFTNDDRPSTIDHYILYLSFLTIFFLIFANSWVSEDAYITFRVIDNWAHGYGLRWNVHERVQVYTHPLWLLLHLPFTYLTNNLFLLNIALSILCSALAVGIVLLTFKKNVGVTLVCFMLPLLLSKTFREYATSGLETPLSLLLFACFGYVLVRLRESCYFWFLLALTSSLLLLNRLDHLLVIAPVLFLLSLQEKEKYQIFFGALPLIAWFGFALFYYGFLFPNTKYAKLDTGFPLATYFAQGAQYYFIWLTHDMASVLTMITSLFFCLRTTNDERRTTMLSLGLIANLLYILYIGGDYMMGRFFAFPFFVSCWLLLAAAPDKLPLDRLVACALALMTAWTATFFIRDIRKECPTCIPVVGKVIDARRTFGKNALFIDTKWPLRARMEGDYKFGRDGKKAAAEIPPPLRPLRYIGMMAYYAGPRAVFIDELALADPLLARLPANTTREFYVGHFRRDIPSGYIEAVRTRDLSSMQPDLAQYYAKLRIITEGNLWDTDRLMTILRFHFRQYEAYRHAYLDSIKPR